MENVEYEFLLCPWQTYTNKVKRGIGLLSDNIIKILFVMFILNKVIQTYLVDFRQNYIRDIND